jgi:hypothetical protein
VKEKLERRKSGVPKRTGNGYRIPGSMNRRKQG